jgi:hypothetical protein
VEYERWSLEIAIRLVLWMLFVLKFGLIETFKMRKDWSSEETEKSTFEEISTFGRCQTID